MVRVDALYQGKAEEFLVKDEDLKRWYDNIDNHNTRIMYMLGVGRYANYRRLTPSEIVTEFHADQKHGEDKFMDFVNHLKKNHPPKTIHNYAAGVKSWLRHNGLMIVRKVSAGNNHETPTVEGEYAPDQKTLSRLIGTASLRGKAAMSLIAFAGIRPHSIINLRLKDIPDHEIVHNQIQFKHIPAQIKIPAKHSKNKRPYFTFLTDEGCQHLKTYLDYRARREKLTGDSFLLISTKNGGKLSTRGWHGIVKETFKKLGYAFRPYILRSYFDMGILNSRNVPAEIQHFFMGHSGTIEATYTVNKHLPQEQVEEMRHLFKEQIEARLRTTPTEQVPEETRREMLLSMWRDQAKTYGIDPAKVRIERENLTAEEEMSAIQTEIKRFIEQSLRLRQTEGNNNHYENIVIPEKKLESYLNAGWEFQAQVNKAKIVVRKLREP